MDPDWAVVSSTSSAASPSSLPATNSAPSPSTLSRGGVNGTERSKVPKDPYQPTRSACDKFPGAQNDPGCSRLKQISSTEAPTERPKSEMRMKALRPTVPTNSGV